MAAWDLGRLPSGRLCLIEGDERIAVGAVTCFPWSHPHAYISLRDDKGQERAFVHQLEELDAPRRSLLVEELARRNFLPEITAISAIDEELEVFLWHVQTRAGPRRFVTKRTDPVRRLPGGGVLIRDVSADLYVIRDPARLDRRSRGLIWMHID
jgi:hypothetical protein